tara:strand:- start:298 stop:2052 length:1755 start_codon:yes stop_codon:yes gene_type:complete
MADSFVDFGTTGDLDTDQIAGTFDNLALDYVSTADFYAIVTNGTTETEVASSDLTVTTSPTLKLVIANPSSTYNIDADSMVRIGRKTGIASPERVYSDGSVLKAKDLNVSFKQVLFGIQEQVDGGLGSIPTDTDGKLDAGGKILKNLGTPVNGNDGVTKDYVLETITTGTGEPQNWSFNFNDQATSTPGDAWTVSGNDLTRVLTSPVPVSSNDNLYLVEIGGVLQDPDDAYNITEVDGVYTLTVLGANADGYQGQNISVNLRNWGTVRNELLQPFKQTTDLSTDHALTLQNKSESSLGDLIHLKKSDDSLISKIDYTGKLSIPEVSSVTGDLKVTSSVAVRNSDDSADVFKVDKDTENTTVSGASTFTGTATFNGILNAVGGLQKNGASILGIKSIITKTSGLGAPGTTNWVIPEDGLYFIGQQIKLIKETTNYAEGDYIVMPYAFPMWHDASGADDNESVSLTLLVNTADSDVSRTTEYDVTGKESELAFLKPNMIHWGDSDTGQWLNGDINGDGESQSDSIPIIRITARMSSLPVMGLWVYQISAADAALDSITFDVVVDNYSGTPTVVDTYGTTFMGFLLG